MADYKIIDKEKYYRKGVFRHFSEDCKCSTSMTSRIDVTRLAAVSKQTGTKFYINFLYILTKVLNSREDYRMAYLWETGELICYDVINPIQYVFHEDTETCTPVYTTYCEDYRTFYEGALKDIGNAKATREYMLDSASHPNWFDASYISWLSYDSFNIELPDGYLYFPPIVNWGKYKREGGRLVMPVSVRLNHAIADGFHVANVFRLLQKEMGSFCDEHCTLYTDRLILRRVTENDIPDIYEAARDPEVGPRCGWPPHKNIGESEFVVRNVLKGDQCYCIALKENNKAIGIIEIKLFGTGRSEASSEDECELGFWLGRSYWGNGYMPEAGREMIRHAFEDLDMKKIYCGHIEENAQSARVQEKLGFRFLRRTENMYRPLMDDHKTDIMNVLTRSEWESDS